MEVTGKIEVDGNEKVMAISKMVLGHVEELTDALAKDEAMSERINQRLKEEVEHAKANNVDLGNVVFSMRVKMEAMYQMLMNSALQAAGILHGKD